MCALLEHGGDPTRNANLDPIRAVEARCLAGNALEE
jgi:hypothetical protein